MRWRGEIKKGKLGDADLIGVVCMRTHLAKLRSEEM